MFSTKRMRKKANIWGWIFAIPTVVGICAFTFYPIIYSLILSLTNYRSLPTDPMDYIGLKNYEWIFKESSFFKGMWLSFQFTVITTVIQTILGFIMAYMLYRMTPKMQSAYRVILYLPNILPAAVASVMWTFIYEPNYGLLDTLFSLVNIDAPNWLGDPAWKMPSIVIVNTWKHVGLTMIIYFVAMNAIDKQIIESAQIDGAGSMGILRSIILPITWYTTRINVLLSLIGGLKSFDLFYLLFKDDPAMQVVGLYIYNTAYGSYVYCRASAMALLLAAIISCFSILANKLLAKGEKV